MQHYNNSIIYIDITYIICDNVVNRSEANVALRVEETLQTIHHSLCDVFPVAIQCKNIVQMESVLCHSQLLEGQY